MQDIKTINTLDALLSKIDSRHVVVTAGKRLAREINQQYHHRKVTQGTQVWATPDILPFQTWSRTLWQNLVSDHSSPTTSRTANRMSSHLAGRITRPIVLSPQQTLALWQKVIRQDIGKNHADSEPLWSIDATASSANQAWRIAHQWQIDISRQGSLISDHAGFGRWAESFVNLCRNNNWISSEQLPGEIIDSLDLRTDASDPSKNMKPGLLEGIPGIILCGFDLLTPVQTKLFEQLNRLGFEIAIHQPEPNQTPKPSTKVFLHQSEQWHAAAKWAKAAIESNPDKRLAIIVPELESCRDQIDQALSRVLSPQYFLNGTNDRTAYHIALGKPLANFEVIKAALELLSLFSKSPQPAALVHAFLLSPYVAEADLRRSQRSSLDAILRQFLPFQIKPKALPNIIELAKKRHDADQDTALKLMLASIADFHDQAPLKQSWSKWAETILDLLETLGWPGSEAPDSESFQAIDAFKSELQVFAGLDLVSSETFFEPALNQLISQLSSQKFEPQSLAPRLEVIDVAESAGLEFDAIWFADLTQSNWPRPARPNPFLSISEQKARGYFYASIENSLLLATHQQQRLARQSQTFIQSYFSRQDDVPVRPSPMINAESGFESDSFKVEDGLFAMLCDHQLQRQGFIDETGIALTGDNASGGTSLIQNQALCGFKAYAHHRLDAGEISTRDQGLDPIARGQLVHRVLEDCWREIHSSTNLRKLDNGALEALISEKIKQNNNAFIAASGCELGFFDSHSNWLEKLLMSWFELEKQRNLEFVATALETPVELTLGGLRLKFKIDRVDYLEDGSLCIIDYKTGKAALLGDWVGERPAYPQLALYALAIKSDRRFAESSVSSTVVAQVKPNDSRFRGLCSEAPFYIEEVRDRIVKQIEKANLLEGITDWQTLHHHWQESLGELAEQFRRGEAPVDPLDEQVCSFCNLHTFCRIYEKTQQN